MILGIIQARTSSNRLPGKVLMPLLGQPMLARQIERLRRANNIDQLLVATSTEPDDDSIAILCQQLDIPCFRGPLDDVLNRFYLAAHLYPSTHIVRLTADCPLTDPDVIDELIRLHIEGNYDYSSNCWTPTYPDGIDAEVMTMATLERLQAHASTQAEREHVTYYIRRHHEQFNIGRLSRSPSLEYLRWTVDEPADFALVEQIYTYLYPDKPAFTSADILQLLDLHPELQALNSQYTRNEGLAKTLVKETNS